ncbi:MAG: hypothetical protein HKN13_09900 [Rhodothermales bacterium]|nr:hypothetical protein [Rhodothermales bacterium]
MGKLCRRLSETDNLDPASRSRISDSECYLEGSVAAGAVAKLSGVHQYRLSISYSVPSSPEIRQEAGCNLDAASIQPADRSVSFLLPTSEPVCPARRDDTLIKIRLVGKKGW